MKAVGCIILAGHQAKIVVYMFPYKKAHFADLPRAKFLKAIVRAVRSPLLSLTLLAALASFAGACGRQHNENLNTAT